MERYVTERGVHCLLALRIRRVLRLKIKHCLQIAMLSASTWATSIISPSFSSPTLSLLSCHAIMTPTNRRQMRHPAALSLASADCNNKYWSLCKVLSHFQLPCDIGFSWISIRCEYDNVPECVGVRVFVLVLFVNELFFI